MSRHRDLPIEWAPALPHEQLVARLQDADIFVLPSLEEGLVRTALEAMACGLPVVLTPHTGAHDFVRPGVNGEIVPIRDPVATAEAVLKCWERVRSQSPPDVTRLREQFSFATFSNTFLSQLEAFGLISNQVRPDTNHDVVLVGPASASSVNESARHG
jgi:glycosyltransferase involved in cell wall biosynthesis